MVKFMFKTLASKWQMCKNRDVIGTRITDRFYYIFYLDRNKQFDVFLYGNIGLTGFLH